MSAITSPHATGTALLDRPAPGSALDPAQHKDCFPTRLREVLDKLEGVLRGDHNWALEEDLLLPPQTALNYCRKEAKNIAGLLSFRQEHPRSDMIPSPVFTPYGEEGEISIRWGSMQGSLFIELESEKGLVWHWYRIDRSTEQLDSGSVSIDDKNLWAKLKEIVCLAFTNHE